MICIYVANIFMRFTDIPPLHKHGMVTDILDKHLQECGVVGLGSWFCFSAC